MYVYEGALCMITEEHLKHWLSELQYQLNGIRNEIAEDKIGTTKNVLVNDKNVSFEYLREKADTLKGTIECIEYDILHDG